MEAFRLPGFRHSGCKGTAFPRNDKAKCDLFLSHMERFNLNQGWFCMLYLAKKGSKKVFSAKYKRIIGGIWVKKCIFRQLYRLFLLSLPLV